MWRKDARFGATSEKSKHRDASRESNNPIQIYVGGVATIKHQVDTPPQHAEDRKTKKKKDKKSKREETKQNKKRDKKDNRKPVPKPVPKTN